MRQGRTGRPISTTSASSGGHLRRNTEEMFPLSRPPWITQLPTDAKYPNSQHRSSVANYQSAVVAPLPVLIKQLVAARERKVRGPPDPNELEPGPTVPQRPRCNTPVYGSTARDPRKQIRYT